MKKLTMVSVGLYAENNGHRSGMIGVALDADEMMMLFNVYDNVVKRVLCISQETMSCEYVDSIMLGLEFYERADELN